MGESPRRSVRTAVDLRDAIAAAMIDATTRALNAGPTEAVDLGGPINSVMLAIDEYADHLRDMWAHNPSPPAPALGATGASEWLDTHPDTNPDGPCTYTPCGDTTGKYAHQPCVLRHEHWDAHVDRDGNRWEQEPGQ